MDSKNHLPDIDQSRLDDAWAVLSQVPDPEIPIISVCDLGIVRDLVNTHKGIEVVITPTYSGCPATEQIANDIMSALTHAGIGPAHIRIQLSPAWTTDWISAAGQNKLRAYGIAPPGTLANQEQPIYFKQRVDRQVVVCCPHCSSNQTEKISTFGSTACKALYRCLSCREPFEYFKPI